MYIIVIKTTFFINKVRHIYYHFIKPRMINVLIYLNLRYEHYYNFEEKQDISE